MACEAPARSRSPRARRLLVPRHHESRSPPRVPRGTHPRRAALQHRRGERSLVTAAAYACRRPRSSPTLRRGLAFRARDHVIVYDASGINFSAPRVWWMFRAFGHDAVSLLDGGLAAWKAARRRTRARRCRHARGRCCSTPSLRPAMLRSAAQVLELHQQRRTAQVVDMRSRGRFEGTEPEPRAGASRRSHSRKQESSLRAVSSMAGACSVVLRSCARSLQDAGIDVGRPVIAIVRIRRHRMQPATRAACARRHRRCALRWFVDRVGPARWNCRWKPDHRADAGDPRRDVRFAPSASRCSSASD